MVKSARLEIHDVWSLSALCGQFVKVSLRWDAPLPKNVTEDRSKVTCRRCLRLMGSMTPDDRAAFRRKVSKTPDFGKTWEEREAIAENVAKIDCGCAFDGNRCRAMQDNYRGCCCQPCACKLGFLEKIKPSAFTEILSLFDRVWGFWRPGEGCILPRKWQSPRCLFFACLPFMNEKGMRDLVQISASAGPSKCISDALAVTLMDADIHAR